MVEKSCEKSQMYVSGIAGPSSIFYTDDKHFSTLLVNFSSFISIDMHFHFPLKISTPCTWQQFLRKNWVSLKLIRGIENKTSIGLTLFLLMFSWCTVLNIIYFRDTGNSFTGSYARNDSHFSCN